MLENTERISGIPDSHRTIIRYFRNEGFGSHVQLVPGSRRNFLPKGEWKKIPNDASVSLVQNSRGFLRVAAQAHSSHTIEFPPKFARQNFRYQDDAVVAVDMAEDLPPARRSQRRRAQGSEETEFGRVFAHVDVSIALKSLETRRQQVPSYKAMLVRLFTDSSSGSSLHVLPGDSGGLLQ